MGPIKVAFRSPKAVLPSREADFLNPKDKMAGCLNFGIRCTSRGMNVVTLG
jgi:hypothetical protein